MIAFCCVAARSAIKRRAAVPPAVASINRRTEASSMVSVRRELTAEPLYCFTPFCDSAVPFIHSSWIEFFLAVEATLSEATWCSENPQN